MKKFVWLFFNHIMQVVENESLTFTVKTVKQETISQFSLW